MIQTFKDKQTQSIFKRRSVVKFKSIERQALRRLTYLHAATSLDDLKLPPSNRFEKLKGKKKEYYSLRINKQWRICFKWEKGHAYEVEILDYH